MNVQSPTSIDIAIASRSLKLKGGEVWCDSHTRKETVDLKKCLPSSKNRDRTFVQHKYKDHYHDPIFQGQLHEMMVCGIKPQRKGPRGGVVEPFPAKLHALLSKVEPEGIANVISWQPHGRCFVVHQPKSFSRDVMPKYFNHSKFTSFQRQLNLYGFRRLTKGADRGGYYHEMFLRGRPDLCNRMIRMKIKGNGRKAAPSPETEPQFYSMEPCTETPFLTQHKNSTTIASLEDEILVELETSSSGNDSFPPLEKRFQGSSSKRELTTVKLVDNEPFEPLLSLKTTMTCSVVSPEASPALSALPNLPVLPSPDFALSETRCDKKQLSTNLEMASIRGDYPCDEFFVPDLPSSLEPFNSEEKIFFEGCPFYYLDRGIIEDLKQMDMEPIYNIS